MTYSSNLRSSNLESSAGTGQINLPNGLRPTPRRCSGMAGLDALTACLERRKMAGNGNTYTIPAYPGSRCSGSRGSSLGSARSDTSRGLSIRVSTTLGTKTATSSGWWRGATPSKIVIFGNGPCQAFSILFGDRLTTKAPIIKNQEHAIAAHKKTTYFQLF